MVAQSDYIVSIVPPKDALATAERIIGVLHKKPKESGSSPLYYLDLNAVAPSTAKEIGSQLSKFGEAIRFIDGGIIGGPPKQTDASQAKEDFEKWYRPSIVLSGPNKLSDAPLDGAHLADLLRTKHVGEDIGTASGL